MSALCRSVKLFHSVSHFRTKANVYTVSKLFTYFYNHGIEATYLMYYEYKRSFGSSPLVVGNGDSGLATLMAHTL